MLSLHIDTGRAWGGGQHQVMQTVVGLRALGQRAVLVARPDGELLKRMREGMDLVPLAPQHDVDLAAAWRLSRVVKQMRPEVVHAHDPGGLAMSALALSIAAPSPRPALVAAHRIESRLPHSSFSRWTHGEADGFIANTGVTAARLVTDGIPRSKISVVHEGVDVDRIARLAPADVHAEFYLPHGSPVVGNVGALVPHKGHHDLIDAAALVVRDVPDARFVIIGDGELRESLERQIKDRHLERHVFLAGFRLDAVELIKGCDLFAVSPVHEGMCTALVEAMAAAKAAVATSAGGIPEVMADGETGYLVSPRDHHGMADRLVFLLKHPATRAAMGEAALRRARDRFTVEQMVAATAAVYERLAGMRPAADTASPAVHG
jgi:glycosyltransferase involved in cell wall biosynthesis